MWLELVVVKDVEGVRGPFRSWPFHVELELVTLPPQSLKLPLQLLHVSGGEGVEYSIFAMGLFFYCLGGTKYFGREWD